MRQRSKSNSNEKMQFLKNQKNQVQKKLYRNQVLDLDLMFSRNQARVKKMDLVTQQKEMEDLDDEYTRRRPTTSRRTTRSTTYLQRNDIILWTS